MKIRKFLFRALCTSIVILSFSVCVLAVGLENFSQITGQSLVFTDVGEAEWFTPYVKLVSQKKLIVGNDALTFNPHGNITLAECVTIASRLHSIFHTGTEKFVQGPVWYQTYLDYARKADIYFPNTIDITRQATRAEFARIIASAFPPEALIKLNDISDGEIPDVSTDMPSSEAVYTLYRAGILTGNDDAGTFAPYSEIHRSEVAAIVSRMVVPDMRVRFDLRDKYAENKYQPGQDQITIPDFETNDDDFLPNKPTGSVSTNPVIHIETVEAIAGQKQVAVTISIKNNPGIAALALNVSHSSNIELTDIVYNDQLSGETMLPQSMKNPTKLIWLNPFEDVETDFVLATAYFTVLSEGNHQITAMYNPDDIYNLDEENIFFEVMPGKILAK